MSPPGGKDENSNTPISDQVTARSASNTAGASLSHESGLIVGIGASAGGLNAYKSFLENMPVDSGMAFVLVQHLAPDHKSALADLLGRATKMPVIDATDGVFVAANCVYVIPPNATLTIKDRKLAVAQPAPPRDRRRPIDSFFLSLAEDQEENAVCIILSGTGSDGTFGLKAIKEHGGFALAQAETDHTAMSGMPYSAAATGLVDEVMPVEAMPAKLIEYARHLATVAARKDDTGTRRDMAEHLMTISRLLSADFVEEVARRSNWITEAAKSRELLAAFMRLRSALAAGLRSALPIS